MTVCLPADSDQFIVLDQGVPFCNKHYLNDRMTPKLMANVAQN